MKVSTVFIILGVIAVGGYATYKYWESTNHDSSVGKGEKAETSSNSVNAQWKPDEVSNSSNMSSDETLDEVVEELDFEKMDIQHDIIQRHEAAAKIMKESMEHIIEEDAKKLTSENAENLDKIDEALDKLLDE